MAEKILSTVRDVAAKLIEESGPYHYEANLLGILPEHLLAREVTEENGRALSAELDGHRYFKQGYLADMLELPESSLSSKDTIQKLREILNKHNIRQFS